MNVQRYELIPNDDGYTINVYIDETIFLHEFSSEFEKIREPSATKRIVQSIKEKYKRLKITKVNILVGTMLLTTVPIGDSELSAHSVDFNMSYLFVGGTTDFIRNVDQTNNSLNVVSPSYFDLHEDGSLKLSWQVDRTFVDEMHTRGMKVVPFLSNHWDRSIGRAALENREQLSNEIANAIEQYNLDGVNVDIENVTDIDRDAYTDLVRLLREKIPAHKEVSVAVAANPKGWDKGWHGSYDYHALSKYADYLMIMAYDESYPGSPEGPVASYAFVENSILFALNEGVSPEQIVLGVPFYGRYWKEGATSGGSGISNYRVQQMVDQYETTLSYDEGYQSPKAVVTIKDEDPPFSFAGRTLGPGTYHIWYENDRSIKAKMDLVHKYELKGTGSWSLEQATTSIWDHYKEWAMTHSEVENEGRKYSMTTSNVNLRSYASTSADIVKTLPTGTSVKITGQTITNGNYTWLPVITSTGDKGYVASAYLRSIGTTNLEGSDRYETSVAISKTGWETGSKTVILGRGDVPVDALAGSVLAKKYNAPLLLTKTNGLPVVIQEELRRLNPDTVYLLGGSGAISSQVEEELKRSGITTKRIAGGNRHETSVKIAAAVNASHNQVFITTSNEHSPDALSIASYAGMEQIPIILTDTKQLSSDAIQYLQENGITKVTIIGGNGAVSANVESQVKQIGITDIERIAGSNRYETSIAIAKRYTSQFDKSEVFFASGISFIDALPGSPLAAHANRPIVLVDRKEQLPEVLATWLEQDITIEPKLVFLGGNGPIPEHVRLNIMMKALNK
ncbi:cell wall-binding repeat-containing protein [Salirhabdus salicampi]|uniref:cell wall-binding repeat-containing protein n=1 Tax=Salirhabdus salicampi TaxID=476102 RepID=UPI0020C29657|nr:cell wall-binding repeat-containing protein [Salirhabdus salicampi]MCP8615986.1 cell wall-binding repeat-containing protein [Salirhabdus salicampi]